MAITYDNYTTGGGSWSRGSGPGTYTYNKNITIGNHTNRVLIVAISTETQTADDGDITVTGVKYNGSSLTQIGSRYLYRHTTDLHNSIDFWYLLAPYVGTATIAVSFNGVLEYGIGYFTVGAMSFYNIKQQAPEASAQNGGTGTSSTATLTTLTSGSLVVSATANNLTDRFHTTTDTEVYDSSASTMETQAGGYAIDAVQGSFTFTWSLESATWGQKVIAFQDFDYGISPSRSPSISPSKSPSLSSSLSPSPSYSPSLSSSLSPSPSASPSPSYSPSISPSPSHSPSLSPSISPSVSPSLPGGIIGVYNEPYQYKSTKLTFGGDKVGSTSPSSSPSPSYSPSYSPSASPSSSRSPSLSPSKSPSPSPSPEYFTVQDPVVHGGCPFCGYLKYAKQRR